MNLTVNIRHLVPVSRLGVSVLGVITVHSEIRMSFTSHITEQCHHVRFKSVQSSWQGIEVDPKFALHGRWLGHSPTMETWSALDVPSNQLHR